jgi:acyl dehydratase
MSDVYYFDDLQIGQRFVSASRTMSEAEIKAFAREFDPQPFHLDEELATRSLFAGLSASGWHTAAVTMRLMVDGAAPIAGGVIGVGGEIEWPRPVRPGDTLQVHTEVVAAVPSRSRPDRGVVTIRCETRNQSGEPVQVFVGKLIVPKRPNPR